MAVHVLATNLAQQHGGFEPQRQHNWNIEFALAPLGVDADVISLALVGGFLPRCMNEDVPLPYGNETVYVAGKATWDRGQIIVRDFIDQPVAQSLWTWREQVYSPGTGQIGLAANYKVNADIVLFSPNSQENNASFERVWRLIGCWPMTIDFAAQGLDMASSNVVMINMTLRYDKAFAIRNLSPSNRVTGAIAAGTLPNNVSGIQST